MARRTTPNSPPLPATMNQEQIRKGIKRLESRLVELSDFNPESVKAKDAYAAVRPIAQSIETAIAETFGYGTVEYNRFYPACDFTLSYFGDLPPLYELIERVSEQKTVAHQLLSAAVALLKDRLEDVGTDTAAPTINVSAELSNKVFIVHGHDNEVKEAAARFLQAVGLQPVILHELANKGRTIIQKFREEAADVGFALVLMTPDDKTADGRDRARQNVVLELGFFLGALGPDRVAAIVKGDLERPSDFDGVVYINFDAGWKIAVSKELLAAGYNIDWNVVMRQ